MVNNIVRWPFSIFCPQHIADWWNGISVCCLKWVQLITNFERVLWRWLKAECVVCVCRGVNKISRNFSNVWRTWQRSIPNFHRNEKSWEILSPKKERSAFRVRAFSECCDVYRNFVDTSTTWLTGALGCPTTEAGQRKRGGDETQFRSRAALLLLRVRRRGLDSWDSMLLNVSNKITI